MSSFYQRPAQCYSCGEEGHSAVNCPASTGGYFNGECYHCGQWGHQARFCTVQKAQLSTDEYERADGGYAYNPQSDYYNTYNEDMDECEDKSQHGIYSLMVRVVDDSGDTGMTAGSISKFARNLDSYCTRHMTPCFLLEQPKPCVVDIVVGNKERLQPTHN